MSIKFGEIKRRSVFLFGFVSSLAFLLPVVTFFGILGALGFNVITLNGAHVYGIAAILTAWFLGLLFSIFGSVVLTIGTIIMSKVAPRLETLQLKSDENPEAEIFE